MKSNILVYEIIPDAIYYYRIPENLVSSDELIAINGFICNADFATEKQWEIYEKLEDLVFDEGTRDGSVEELHTPFAVKNGEVVYAVGSCAL